MSKIIYTLIKVNQINSNPDFFLYCALSYLKKYQDVGGNINIPSLIKGIFLRASAY